MFRGIKLFFREISGFYRFFFKTSSMEKTILFYSEHEGYYPYFEGIIEKLIGVHGKTLCYVTSDSNDPILKTSETRIKTFYIRNLLPFFMLFIDCKVCVITLTDLNQFHIKRAINAVHYVYVFHSPVSTHMMYREGAFDHYDSILCVGPHQIQEIRKYEQQHQLASKRLSEAGYYRLERIFNAHQRYTTYNPSPSKKETILIAPSWGPKNILESCGEKLVELLLQAGYEVIVRPHPETVRRRPDILKALSVRFGKFPAFTLELSVATDNSLLRSDVLICDCSGVALEYAFGTERPVLFFDVPLKIRNQKYRELGIEPLEVLLRNQIGVIVSLKDLETIPEIITKLRSESEVYKSRLARFREKYVFAFGRSSHIGADWIVGVSEDAK